MDKKVLLIADDVPMARAIISKFLGDTYQVVEAENGRRVLEILQATHVDAILLDIIMPEMDGLETLTIIKAEKKYENVGILVATSTKEKTERMALSLGADDIVAKPYDPVVIKKRLENILGMKELGRHLRARESEGAEAAVRENLEGVQRRADQVAERIRRYAKLISASKENYAVVNELLAELCKQSDQLDVLTKEAK